MPVEVLPPLHTGFIYDQQLSVSNIVPSLSRGKLFAVKIYWLSILWTLHLLVFKCFFSTLDIFVAVSAVVRAAPIVGAAVWDEYARLRWTNFLFTSLTSFNQQKFFFNIFLTICFICPTISIPGLQWHMLAALSGCPQMEHTKHTGRERQFESFERKTIDTVFFQL